MEWTHFAHFLYKFGDYPDAVARVLAAAGLTEISEEIHAEVAKMRTEADEKVNPWEAAVSKFTQWLNGEKREAK